MTPHLKICFCWLITCCNSLISFSLPLSISSCFIMWDSISVGERGREEVVPSHGLLPEIRHSFPHRSFHNVAPSAHRLSMSSCQYLSKNEFIMESRWGGRDTMSDECVSDFTTLFWTRWLTRKQAKALERGGSPGQRQEDEQLLAPTPADLCRYITSSWDLS